MPAFLLALYLLTTPVSADRLRISPDDLRLRVAVSEELPASLRREIRDLARSTPLPVENGLVQTERLIEETFAGRGWKTKRSTLVRYYFLVSRLEQSQKFSDEFLRRRSLLDKAVSLLDAYIETLNRQIARAVYTNAPTVSPEEIASFPLEEVEKTETGELLILHRFPAPDIGLGRENLRILREIASDEKARVEERRKSLEEAEAKFLAEVSILGQELLGMREQVREWVRVPGEGLPFSF
ncbi:MAG: hypothetical protein KC800_30210 [Candidatus Eremiobacteraeota bacterium]|nr:hypothetical protein [Candidatus Eremiobacteraeota bacterium]